jgi:hypothetical protein
VADSSVSIKDASGATVTVDAQLVGTDEQQTINIGDGVNAGRVANVGKSGGLAIVQARPTGLTINVTAATPVTGTWVDVSEAQSVTVIVKNTVAATAFTGIPVLAYHISDDQTTFTLLTVFQPLVTGSANQQQSTVYGLPPGTAWFRVDVTTAQATQGMTVIIEPSAAPSPYGLSPAYISKTGALTSSGLIATLAGNPNVSVLSGSITVIGIQNIGVGTTGDIGAKTATFNGSTQTNAAAKGVTVVFAIGTVSGTTPVLVAKLQVSADGGTTWVDLPGATTASLVATGAWGIQVYPGVTPVVGTTTPGTLAVVNAVLPKTWRVVYTISGTTPSFALTNVQISYLI